MKSKEENQTDPGEIRSYRKYQSGKLTLCSETTWLQSANRLKPLRPAVSCPGSAEV